MDTQPVPPLAVVSPDDHLVFSPMMEELFVKRLGPSLGPRDRESLRKAGMDIDKKLLPAYPLRVLDAAMEVVARSALSHLQPAQAYQRLGTMQVDAFAETLIGRAAFALMKLFTITRFLDRITRSCSNANNFIDTRVTPVDAHTWELWVNDVGRFPEVIQGILQACLGRLGHAATVDVVRRDGLACVYRLVVLPQ